MKVTKETSRKQKGIKKDIGGSSSSLPSVSPTVVQAKLEMTRPNDAFEQEAERMADYVTGKAATGSISTTNHASPATCISRIPANQSSVSIGPELESTISSSRGGGFAMPSALRLQMEGSFGTDFSGVRFHTDSAANDMSASINAKAFTSGKDIYFGVGQYDPHSISGQHLIAHELTHTLQQGGRIARQVDDATHGNRPDAETLALKTRNLIFCFMGWLDVMESVKSTYLSEVPDIIINIYKAGKELKVSVSEAATYSKNLANRNMRAEEIRRLDKMLEDETRKFNNWKTVQEGLEKDIKELQEAIDGKDVKKMEAQIAEGERKLATLTNELKEIRKTLAIRRFTIGSLISSGHITDPKTIERLNNDINLLEGRCTTLNKEIDTTRTELKTPKEIVKKSEDLAEKKELKKTADSNVTEKSQSIQDTKKALEGTDGVGGAKRALVNSEEVLEATKKVRIRDVAKSGGKLAKEIIGPAGDVYDLYSAYKSGEKSDMSYALVGISPAGLLTTPLDLISTGISIYNNWTNHVVIDIKDLSFRHAREAWIMGNEDTIKSYFPKGMENVSFTPVLNDPSFSIEIYKDNELVHVENPKEGHDVKTGKLSYKEIDTIDAFLHSHNSTIGKLRSDYEHNYSPAGHYIVEEGLERHIVEPVQKKLDESIFDPLSREADKLFKNWIYSLINW